MTPAKTQPSEPSSVVHPGALDLPHALGKWGTMLIAICEDDRRCLLKLAEEVPGLRDELFDGAVRAMKYRSFVTAPSAEDGWITGGPAAARGPAWRNGPATATAR
ncbi:hypothetical protein [Streptomyces hydrogenans]|uniref:hypothetical protein n=2 Tax=Streptomyces hydrogenans TaxID=1873719 RepID=UPI00382C2FA5